uniref:Uncharacterized protein n=1 Tax=Cacopsylla melanoneura TaxID=428564 RepID=A0A8D9EB05_9HEMI
MALAFSSFKRTGTFSLFPSISMNIIRLVNDCSVDESACRTVVHREPGFSPRLKSSISILLAFSVLFLLNTIIRASTIFANENHVSTSNSCSIFFTSRFIFFTM